ncbi:hypothetical protein JL721_5995 [Aureococcus anophagefferens]|nr:hypothetical protein JL721_5995 [Aureococcus anophagefferens]
MRHVVAGRVDNVCATALRCARRRARGAAPGALPRGSQCCPGAVDAADDDGGGAALLPEAAGRCTSHEAERRRRADGEEKPAARGGRERRALAAALGGGRQRRFRLRSPIAECAKLFAALVEGGTRTLAFGRTRKLVELVLGYAKERLEAGRAESLAAARIAAATAREDRIERGLFGGGLAGVVATNALELGVDVGDLDATVHLGHPGSIASLWQQAGCAGRDANSTSAAIVVCWDSPIDQHFARRGGDVLKRPVEPAALQVANESVLADQLVCAAAEAPLEARDRPFFALACGCSGGDRGGAARPLVTATRRVDGRFAEAPGGGWAAASHAADHARAVSLRVVDPVTFSVKCGGAVVDEVPYSRAFYELYEGAVYLIQAAPHLVTRLDVMTHEATVKRLGACDYITSSPARDERATFPTSSRNHTDVDPEKVLRSNREVRTGVVHVSSKVWGYRKVCKKTLRILSMHEFSLPNLEFTTRATRALDAIAARRLDARAGLHALNHALLALAPLFVLCDPGDVATAHVYPFQTRPPLRAIVYDARPGGLGVAEELYHRMGALLREARTLLACPCGLATGCPACLHDGRRWAAKESEIPNFKGSDLGRRCTGHNVALDRDAARLIVDALLDRGDSTAPLPPGAGRRQRQRRDAARSVKGDAGRAARPRGRAPGARARRPA